MGTIKPTDDEEVDLSDPEFDGYLAIKRAAMGGNVNIDVSDFDEIVVSAYSDGEVVVKGADD